MTYGSGDSHAECLSIPLVQLGALSPMLGVKRAARHPSFRPKPLLQSSQRRPGPSGNVLDVIKEYYFRTYNPLCTSRWKLSLPSPKKAPRRRSGEDLQAGESTEKWNDSRKSLRSGIRELNTGPGRAIWVKRSRCVCCETATVGTSTVFRNVADGLPIIFPASRPRDWQECQGTITRDDGLRGLYAL
jgi:hypothetical protein